MHEAAIAAATTAVWTLAGCVCPNPRTAYPIAAFRA
jgi:hypothetical protein